MYVTIAGTQAWNSAGIETSGFLSFCLRLLLLFFSTFSHTRALYNFVIIKKKKKKNGGFVDSPFPSVNAFTYRWREKNVVCSLFLALGAKTSPSDSSVSSLFSINKRYRSSARTSPAFLPNLSSNWVRIFDTQRSQISDGIVIIKHGGTLTELTWKDLTRLAARWFGDFCERIHVTRFVLWTRFNPFAVDWWNGPLFHFIQYKIY